MRLLKADDIKNNTLTEAEKATLNRAYNLMLTKTTKQELMANMGETDRSMRNIISAVKVLKPVITLSSKDAGYKVARTEQDLEACIQSLHEDLSRAYEILVRTVKKAEFIEKMGYTNETLNNVNKAVSLLNKPKKYQRKMEAENENK